MKKDTIAAISTGMSNSGISIIRISGPDAFTVADAVFKGKNRLSDSESHRIHYGFIKDGEETIDQVLVSVMREPRTYTGEDTVEINCHGGVYVTRKVLERVFQAGARPAEPGEFTKRAFLNGKMDLSQAEAVMDVISSKNEYALKSSLSQLKGSVRNKITDIRNKIIYDTAYIESALDDPEHISMDGFDDTLYRDCEEIVGSLDRLILSYDDGRIISEGVQTVILGKPNAGKSSLLNILAGYDRAIVTEVEGTTRDVLEERIRLKGLNLNIVDTAGIRSTEDIVEKLGVEKAKEYAKNADLIIYVADSSRPLDENDRNIIKIIEGKKALILLNKSDLSQQTDENMIRECLRLLWEGGDADIPILTISAKMQEGIDILEDTINNMFIHGKITFNDEVYITNERQKSALSDAKKSIENVMDSISAGMPEDFYTIDLMDGYESLGTITGESVGEDLANEIFSKFCMGK